jgi:hypothetical protein
MLLPPFLAVDRSEAGRDGASFSRCGDPLWSVCRSRMRVTEASQARSRRRYPVQAVSVALSRERQT